MESSTCCVQVIDTQQYADSVEWCPFEGLEHILLCGTYQLLEPAEENKQVQVRVGQLQVFCLDNFQSHPLLSQSHCKDMPGVLDIKWARQRLDSAAVFGLVNADGDLKLWKIDDSGSSGTESKSDGAGVKLDCLKTAEIGQCIGLSLDWVAPHESSVPRIVTSDSTGNVSMFEIRSDDVVRASQWHAHNFEAWICAFDQWKCDVIYSGSDDCKLKVWDLRAGSTPVITNSRFTMGVCSIQSNPLKEHLLAVGSYDENLRVFDTRQMGQPLSCTALGGGVWRVKWDPFCGHQLLTATMHNGFHIVDCCKPGEVTLSSVLGHYTQHTSLAYGVDWCRLKTADVSKGQCLIASCSFYDHSLHLWRWPA